MNVDSRREREEGFGQEGEASEKLVKASGDTRGEGEAENSRISMSGLETT